MKLLRVCVHSAVRVVQVVSAACTSSGDFLELKEFDRERLEAAWQEAVFALYLAEARIEAEVVENMRSWEHTGFSVDQLVLVPAGDQAGMERLVGYMTRCLGGRNAYEARAFEIQWDTPKAKDIRNNQPLNSSSADSCRSGPDLRADIFLGDIDSDRVLARNSDHPSYTCHFRHDHSTTECMLWFLVLVVCG